MGTRKYFFDLKRVPIIDIDNLLLLFICMQRETVVLLSGKGERHFPFPDLQKRSLSGKVGQFCRSQLEIFPETGVSRFDTTPICRGVDGLTAKVSFTETIPIVSVKANEPTMPENLLDAINSTTYRERESEREKITAPLACGRENLRDDLGN